MCVCVCLSVNFNLYWAEPHLDDASIMSHLRLSFFVDVVLLLLLLIPLFCVYDSHPSQALFFE
jgi:hypothetical protein